MARTPRWKDVFREANAVGWIGLLLLVLAIGAVVIYIGPGRGPERPAAFTQATD